MLIYKLSPQAQLQLKPKIYKLYFDFNTTVKCCIRIQVTPATQLTTSTEAVDRVLQRNRT